MKAKLEIAVMVLIAGFVLSIIPQTINAQSDKQRKKALENQFKEKKKEFTKDNWKIAGTAKTLDVALIEYYDKLNASDNNYEIVGEVSNCNSINVCKQAAFNNAVVEYANIARTYIKGRITSDASIDQSSGTGEFDKFYGAYERMVSTEIQGILQPSFSVVKEKSDGTHTYRTYFVIDEAAASKARIRALENAVKETDMAQESAKKISEFVREGLPEQ